MSDFAALRDELVLRLKRAAPGMRVVTEGEGGVSLTSDWCSPLKPVYTHAELAAKISPALKKRMQGKSCFNFKVADEELFDELEALTREGAGLYR